MSKTNGKSGTATATEAAPAQRARRKTKIILQKHVAAHEDRADHWDDWLDCAGVRDARKQRRESGEQGIFRIIEVLDEFNVAHEQTTKEVITRSGQ